MYELLYNHEGIKAGTVLFDAEKYDYGLAYDDTRLTGIPHISVSLDHDGDYPVFSIPKTSLKEID